MTDTNQPVIGIHLDETTENVAFTPDTPEPIEALFREHLLKVLYWNVGEPRRFNEDDPNTILLATLTVVFTNGKRAFRAAGDLNLDVIYGLVGSDTIDDPVVLPAAVDYLIERAEEIGPRTVTYISELEEFAQALDEWEPGDADIIRSAAAASGGALAELLTAAADVVESLPDGISYANPQAQLAATATRIAWNLL